MMHGLSRNCLPLACEGLGLTIAMSWTKFLFARFLKLLQSIFCWVPQFKSSPPVSFLSITNQSGEGLALQAAGVSEFYDIIFKHWDAQLKDLHAKRLEKAQLMAEKQKENRENYQNEVVQVLDDDDDLENLEKESLQKAMDGVIVEGIINIDDDEPNIVKAPRKVTIDDILKPTGVPPLLISETTKKSQSNKEQIERVRYLPFIA